MKKLLTFEIFNSFGEIVHFCTSRQAGVSEGNFSSFNLSALSGDKPENFHQNLRILSEETEISIENFIFPFQTHEDMILVIDEDFKGLTHKEKTAALHGVDALITKEKGICIGITTADCVPILMFDRKRKVIAAVHAGWRGTCARLLQKTIAKMHETYESNPKDIFALIGPSISAEVYQVGHELINAFSLAGFEFNTIFTERSGKLFLDLWEANRCMLTQSGVPDTQIQISGICTYTQYQNFFSARRLGINSGRMYSGIMLR